MWKCKLEHVRVWGVRGYKTVNFLTISLERILEFYRFTETSGFEKGIYRFHWLSAIHNK